MTLSEAALKYVGAPFLHRGRTVRGMDCIGLVLLAATDCGYIPSGIPTYGREPHKGLLTSGLMERLGTPLTRELRPNDIVVQRLHEGGEPSHVGIITDHPYGLGMVHCYGDIGRVVHQRLGDNRRRLITEAFWCRNWRILWRTSRGTDRIYAWFHSRGHH